MNYIRTNKLLFSLIPAAALIVAFLGFMHQGTRDIQAQGSGSALVGYAWSDNVGWVSFSCSNDDSCSTSSYGVQIGSGGTLSGHAWNDSIGWISFNESDLSGCPSGSCTAHLDETVLSGWGRALSVLQEVGDESHENGDWDGWIQLSDVSVDVGSGEVSGYAWGSDVVGWVQFDHGMANPVRIVTTEGPTVTLISDPTEINRGEDVTLNWETSNASSCEASGGWSGSKSTAETGVESEVVENLLATTNFTLVCQNISSITASTTVQVIVRQPNFSLNLDSGTVEMLSGDPATPEAELTITTDGGFDGDVSLTSSFVSANPPTGVTIVHPTELSAGESADVYVDTPTGIPPGVHIVEIEGTANINGVDVVRTTQLTIYVERDRVQYEDF